MPNLTISGIREGRPIVEMFLGPSRPWADAQRAAGQAVNHAIPVSALVDTGASHSLIVSAVVDELGLVPTGETKQLTGVSATTGEIPPDVPVYTVELLFGVPPVPVAQNLRVLVADLAPFGCRLLLGRDVLDRLVVVYNGPHDQLTIAF